MPRQMIFLEGEEKIKRKMDKLSSSAMRRVTRPASSKAMTPVNKTARQNCKPISETVYKAIGKKQATYSESGVVWTGVGVRKNEKWWRPAPAGYYWSSTQQFQTIKAVNIAHLLELGVRPHEQPNQPRVGYFHPGVAPRPFLRPAWDANKMKVKSVMEVETKRNLTKLIRGL